MSVKIKFQKTVTSTEQTVYMYETETHRFYVRKDLDNRGIWMAEVWTLKNVGVIDPIKVTDKLDRTLIGWTRGEAYGLVEQYIETYSSPLPAPVAAPVAQVTAPVDGIHIGSKTIDH